MTRVAAAAAGAMAVISPPGRRYSPVPARVGLLAAVDSPPGRRLNRLAAVVAGALVGLLPTPAFAQPPKIDWIRPAAVAPGGSIDVSVHGSNLAGATRLWTSFAAQAELAPDVENNGQAGDRVVYRISLPDDAPLGVAAIRLATGRGASNVALIVIDDLPTVLHAGGNHSAASAQQVSLPAAIDGHCDPFQPNYYRFAGRAGQRVTIDVLAQRIGSPLDPVLRLLDAEGRELAYSDDEPALAADCRLALRLPADGDYVIELRDVRGQGSAAHRFRMRVGDFPLVTAAHPPGGKAGTTVRFEPAGPCVEGALPVERALDADSAEGTATIAFRFPDGQGSGFATVVVSQLNETVETDDQDGAEGAAMLELPAAVNGRFHQPGDRDQYRFEAKQGQRLTLTGRTRSLGSPAELLLRVARDDGGSLAEAADTGASEGVLNFTAPQDGTYRLFVEDLLRGGGPEHVYRVEITPYRAGFTLLVDLDKYDAPQDGSTLVDVKCARRDYNGPIELAFEGIDGVALENHVIGEGKNETKMRVTLPESIPSGELRVVRIVGRAKIGEEEFAAAAESLTALRKAMPHTPFPPEPITAQLALGVGPVFPPFFELSLAGEKIEYDRSSGAAQFKVLVKRLDGNFKAALQLAVEGLPEGVAAEIKPVGNGEAEYDVLLKGPESMPQGQHLLRIVGTGTHNNQTKRVVLSDVPLEIR